MDKQQITIYQIAFDQQSASMINPRSGLLMNPKASKYFENDVIVNAYALGAGEMYGFLSYRYESKNKVPINFKQIEKEAKDTDILVMPNCWKNTDAIKEGVQYHGEAFDIAFNYILDMLEVDLQIDFGDRRFPYSVHQNAVVAQKKVWKEYCGVLNAAINLCEKDPILQPLLNKDSGYRGGLSKDQLIDITGFPFYTLHTFVLERLWSAMIHVWIKTGKYSVKFLLPVEEYSRPRVLVCAPQHSSKMYAFEKWWNRVKELTYDNFEVFLADNSETDENSKYFESLGIKSTWIKPLKEGLIATMAKSHQACAEYALQNGFDFILHLETDIVPPRDVIERLLAWKKDVIGGCYDIFFGSSRKAMIQQAESYDRTVRAFTPAQFVEETEPLYFDGNIHRVYHVGLGCVLIHRGILSRIKFRYEKGANVHPDTVFCTDCFQMQIPIYIDSNVQCEHYNQTWLSNIDEIQKNVAL